MGPFAHYIHHVDHELQLAFGRSRPEEIPGHVTAGSTARGGSGNSGWSARDGCATSSGSARSGSHASRGGGGRRNSTGRSAGATAAASTSAIARLDNHELLILIPPGALDHVVQQLFRGRMAVLRVATLRDDVVGNLGGLHMIEVPLGLVPVAALVDMDGDL